MAKKWHRKDNLASIGIVAVSLANLLYDPLEQALKGEAIVGAEGIPNRSITGSSMALLGFKD